MGGDLVVRGAVGLARRAHVAPAVVALSVVAFGTSLPELVVAVQASLARHPGLVLGNVVGSNIANVLLVVGLSAAIYPLAPGGSDVRRNGAIMVAASFGFAALCALGRLDRLGGALLVGTFVLVVSLTARSTVRASAGRDPTTPLDWVLGIPTRLPTIVGFIAVGLLMLPLGADFLVRAGARIASGLGVPDTFVGLTLIAVGTSLPELTTTVLAALQRRADIAVGTVIGSNLFNVMAITGVAALVSPFPIPVSARFLAFDIPVMLVASVLVLGHAWRDLPVVRRTGIALSVAYVVYLGVLVVLV